MQVGPFRLLAGSFKLLAGSFKLLAGPFRLQAVGNFFQDLQKVVGKDQIFLLKLVIVCLCIISDSVVPEV